MNKVTNPNVAKHEGPTKIEPSRTRKKDMRVQPDPDVENYAEVGDNVQKSVDQALEFQNQPDPHVPHKH